MTLIPLDQVVVTETVHFSDEILGETALRTLETGLKLVDGTLTDCRVVSQSKDLLVVTGTLANFLNHSGSNVGIRLYLFEAETIFASTERHCLLLIHHIPTPYVIADFWNAFTSGETSAVQAIFSSASFVHQMMLFSTLAYERTTYITPAFPPEKDTLEEDQKSFINRIRPYVTEGFVYEVAAKLNGKTTIEGEATQSSLQEAFDALAITSIFEDQTFVAQTKLSAVGADFVLRFVFASAISPASTPQFSIEFESIGLSFPLQVTSSVLPLVLLQGSITIGNKLTIEAGFDVTSKYLMLTLTGFPSFEEFVAQFTHSFSMGDELVKFLPVDHFSGLGSITLEALTIGIDFAEVSVDFVQFIIAAEKTLSLIGDVVQVQPAVMVKIQYPFADYRFFEVDVYGRWLIEKAEIDTVLSAYSDEVRVTAQLGLGQSLNVSHLLSTVLGNVKGIPNLNIFGFEFVGFKSGDQTYYEVELDVEAGWQFGVIPLTLDSIHLELAVANGELSEVNLISRLELSGIIFALTAVYDLDNKGWIFNGGTPPAETIHVGQFITNLVTDLKLQSDNKFLQAFETIEITNLFVEYRTFENYPAHFTLFLSLHAGGKFASYLPLDEIVLQFQKDSSNIVWRFDAKADGTHNVSSLVKYINDTHQVQVDLPVNLINLSIQKLGGYYNSSEGHYGFTIYLQIEEQANVYLQIDLIKQPEGHLDKEISGVLVLYEGTPEELVFNMGLISLAQVTDFIAWYHAKTKKAISLRTLAKAIGQIDENVNPPFDLDIRDALFASLSYQTSSSAGEDNQSGAKTETTTSTNSNKYLFAIVLDVDLNLANLPLVGQIFSGDKNGLAGINALQIIYATENITDQDVISLNQLIEIVSNKSGSNLEDNKSFPLVFNKPTAGTTNTQTITALNKGFNVSGILNLGIEQLPISTGGSQPAIGGVEQLQTPPSGNQGGAVSSQMTSPVSPPTGNAQWFAIQKQLGPLYFEKVGVRYEKGEIWFLLNADLSLAGLTIALDGLAVSSPLQKFDPRFHLQGLGIDYQDGPLEIGGMFLRQTYTDAKREPYDEYDGIAILKTEELSLSAIGSYARLDGHPSLFIYAVLDYPLGGPAFFFVTGLSAGFGYNRFLTVPPVEQLLQFPLVSEAVSRAETAPPNSNTVLPLPADGKSNLNNMKNTLAQEMEKLHQYISPQVDQYFLAVGVRFTSFEIIDSFVLVTLAFGGRFELNIIGLTSYATPPGAEEGVPSLVRVELAIKASFLPDEGFLGVRALLTNNSYLFDPACYLVGGMAFYSWFDGSHKGDFALTVGGYHPDFRVPAHYPLVPRLGFLWHYGNQLSIKGGMYFALTGHAIMAGGSLEAVWQDGDLQAWFKTTADFLLSWKPYHYEASVSVDIGGSLTVHAFGTHYITVHLHADLSVWGPKFSGVAHFQIIGIHFSISFGDKKSVPPAIEWLAFRQSFLPQTIYGITVQSGLVKSLKGYALDDKNELVQKAGSTAVHWLLDPKDLALTINSVIPIHSWQLNGELATQFPHSVGVAPMDVRKESFTSNFEITITNDDFTFEPITKPVPAGLWGNIYAPNVNDSSMVPDTVCGFQVSLKEQADEGIGHAIEKKKLSSDTEIIQDAYQWQPTWGKTGETMAKQTTSQQIESGATDPAKQQALLQSLFSLDDTSFLRHTGKLNASDLFAHPMLVEFKD